MRLHDKAKRCQLPDLFDWAAKLDNRAADYRIRWIARRCRVSVATAATLAVNAGFTDREGSAS